MPIPIHGMIDAHAYHMNIRTVLIASLNIVALVLGFACSKNHDNEQKLAREYESTLTQKQEFIKSIDPMLVNTENDEWFLGGPNGWNKTITFKPNGSFIFVENWWGENENSIVYEFSDTTIGSCYTIGNKITITTQAKESVNTISDTYTEPYTVNADELLIEFFQGTYYRTERKTE
jgi:hypothetical protein